MLIPKSGLILIDFSEKNIYRTNTLTRLWRNAMGQVDPVLMRVIARAVDAAHACGRDMNGQSQAAIAAVLTVRPDMTTMEATRAVNRLGMTSAGYILG